MYQKLQKRFMLVSTLVLLLAVLLVEGLVYWISSATVVSQARVMMDLIIRSGGEIPEADGFDMPKGLFLALNTESIYETRFFSARSSESGELSLISLHMRSLSEEEALKLARQVIFRKRDSGIMQLPEGHRLYYERRPAEDSSTLLVVLDTTSRSALITLVMLYTGGLWFVVLLLYVIIMGRKSRSLVRPFIENDERQKRFITNASHELKTPLAVISANTEMTEAMGGRNKWTESTRRQVARLQSLIEDLVVLARLDEMKEIPLTEVDVTGLVREAADAFRPVVEGSGRTFSAAVAENVRTQAERRSLQQVVNILLDNAAKYCDEGGAVSLTLVSRARGKGSVLTVSNTYREGKNADYSRFFERFYRQDESHTGGSGKTGFGIGLSMGREIVERMKGKMKVSYSDDTISFTVTI